MDTLFLTRLNSKTDLQTLREELQSFQLQAKVHSKSIQDNFKIFSYSEALKANRKLADVKAKIMYLERIIYYKEEDVNKAVLDNPDAFDTGGYY